MTYNPVTDVLTVSGGLVGALTGNVTGNVSGSSGSTTGNAATATGLAADPADCSPNEAPRGINASGTATGCAPFLSQTTLDAHLNDTTDAHAGTAITNTPAGNIAATTTQAAINELDTEKIATIQKDANSGVAGLTAGAQIKPEAFASYQAQAPLAESGTISSSTTFVWVEGSGGARTMTTANPRIAAGTKNGQLVWVCGSHSTNTLTIPNGQGIYLKGNMGAKVIGKDNGCSPFVWITDTWYEAIGLSMEDIARTGRRITADQTSPVLIGDFVNNNYVAIFVESGVPKVVGYCGGVPCASSTAKLDTGGTWQVLNGSDTPLVTVINNSGAVNIPGVLTVGSCVGCGAPTPLNVQVTRNAVQSIPHETSTPIAFNVENFDTGTFHDNVTNNSRITFGTAGKYAVTCSAAFLGNDTGLREVFIYKNGTTVIADEIKEPIPGGITVPFNYSLLQNFSATDYIQLMAWQSSGGGALDILQNASTPFCSAWKVD